MIDLAPLLRLARQRPNLTRWTALALFALIAMGLAVGFLLRATPAHSKPRVPPGEARVLLVKLEGPVSPITAEAAGRRSNPARASRRMPSTSRPARCHPR